MSQTVRAYVAQSATSPLAPFTFSARTPRADDVVIDILYTGVCHSDLHTARNDWAAPSIPSSPAMKSSAACAQSVAPCGNSNPATSSALAAWSIAAANARPASII